ncbi:hypothetical protein CVIRNUC_003798 [Coccomyxa viridis]|uniref:Uncharacterized protein n=1 Tax=Coccomyxa viridis TaxID=1274662 RepID=A0AAV1I0G9_9CHLO|nr:hypothetical protein CVIRNUC_003798 [Coccomyxa viridis]
MQQLLEESHEELGLTEVLREVSAVAEFLDSASLLEQPRLRRYLQGRWSLLRGKVERVLLGRAELQSWWDELQECERNLQECLSDNGSGSVVLSGKSSFRSVPSSSGSIRSAQAGRNGSQELSHRNSPVLGCKGSLKSGSSSDSQASTARTSSTHISAARTSSAHVSAPSITSPPASSSNQTTMIGTAGAPAADPLVVRNTLHCPQAAICSCQRKQMQGFGSALLLPQCTAAVGNLEVEPQLLARL